MVTAMLRIWVDHPFNARFLPDVHAKIKTAQTVAAILEHLSRDGWKVEHGEDDNGEIGWVATKEYDDKRQAEAECVHFNPGRWGSFMIDGDPIW